jgi:hypothetical protein
MSITISVEDDTTIRSTTKNVMIYEDKQKLIPVIKLTLLNLLSYYNDRLVIYILNYLYITFFK